MLKSNAFLSSVVMTALLYAPWSVQAQTDQTHRAVLLNAIYGKVSQSDPQKVRLLITQGPAKGCIVRGSAYLNPRRLRYEYDLKPVKCIKNGHSIVVGTVVRGQHNIKGTMANSGMGRDYLISNKGVTVTLSNQ